MAQPWIAGTSLFHVLSAACAGEEGAPLRSNGVGEVVILSVAKDFIVVPIAVFDEMP